VILGVLGGSFDPVHTGHVAMVEHVLRHRLADHVLVIPNRQSPWREAPLAGPHDRLAMCRLAFADPSQVTVDGREIAGPTPSFTVETLAELAQERPTDRLRLVIGGDHLATFRQWREPERILSLAELIVLDRGGLAGGEAARVAADLPPDRLVAAPPFDQAVSASAVRGMLAAGDRPGALLLPPAVAAYIEAHCLYRTV
jgi:nicotinate-nucleotide adenylyltransferase